MNFFRNPLDVMAPKGTQRLTWVNWLGGMSCGTVGVCLGIITLCNAPCGTLGVALPCTNNSYHVQTRPLHFARFGRSHGALRSNTWRHGAAMHLPRTCTMPHVLGLPN